MGELGTRESRPQGGGGASVVAGARARIRRRAPAARGRALLAAVAACSLFLLTTACAAPGDPDHDASDLSGRVVRVFDGDSFVMQRGGRRVEVRVFGIDAPEKGQPFSARARARARALLDGTYVRVAVKTSRDSYGRVVGEVALPDGRDYASIMVGEGLAWQYRRYSKDARIAGLQEEARRARRGLWRDRNPEAPWDYRKQQRERKR